MAIIVLSLATIFKKANSMAARRLMAAAQALILVMLVIMRPPADQLGWLQILATLMIGLGFGLFIANERNMASKPSHRT
ncbi:MAG: hypothetical protein KGO53_03040 [Alphaproteobacteria bacterium]|nr:hypothetical protein [Alphaproteobacteria bacterium]